jgi:hypothetical protein
VEEQDTVERRDIEQPDGDEVFASRSALAEQPQCVFLPKAVSPGRERPRGRVSRPERGHRDDVKEQVERLLDLRPKDLCLDFD